MEFNFEEISENNFNERSPIEPRVIKELEIKELPNTFEELMSICYRVLHNKVSKRYNKLVIDCIKKLNKEFKVELSTEYFRYWCLSEIDGHKFAIHNVSSFYGYSQTRRENRKLRSILKEFKVIVEPVLSYHKKYSIYPYSKIVLPRVIHLIKV